MKVVIFVSSAAHPVNDHIKQLIKRSHHDIILVHHKDDVGTGDYLFLVSCGDIISPNLRDRFTHCLVIHASDLPDGRGWSPHVWRIIEGHNDLIVCLLEAEDKVDTGRIWLKKRIAVPNTALCEEINDLLFEAEIALIEEALENADIIHPQVQPETDDATLTRYQRRTPKDSEINTKKTISEQFNLLRICDNDRYPAYFRLHGQKYVIKIEKADDE